jgi:hypothetical protein
LQFRYRGSRRESAVAQLSTLGSMSAKLQKRVLFAASALLLFGGLSCLFGDYSFSWQATSGESYGSAFVESRRHSAQVCFDAACILLLAGLVFACYGFYCSRRKI